MTSWPLVAGAAACAALVVSDGRRPGALARLAPRAQSGAGDTERHSPPRTAPRALPPVLRVLALAGPAVACVVLVGGLAGLLTGAVAVGAGARWVAGLESAPDVRARRRAAAELPLAVDLLRACLQSGAAPQTALPVVADAVGDPLGAALRRVAAAASMGASPLAAWERARDDEVLRPVLDPLARTMLAGEGSGARRGPALARLSDQLRADLASAGAEAAQSVGVRAVAPLGLCFLPAFVLLGVLPTAWGLVGATLASG